MIEDNDISYNFANQGSFIYGQESSFNSTLRIENQIVQNQFNIQEGAVHLDSNNKNQLSVYIANSTFKNNKALNGNSLFLNNI